MYGTVVRMSVNESLPPAPVSDAGDITYQGTLTHLFQDHYPGIVSHVLAKLHPTIRGMGGHEDVAQEAYMSLIKTPLKNEADGLRNLRSCANYRTLDFSRQFGPYRPCTDSPGGFAVFISLEQLGDPGNVNDDCLLPDTGEVVANQGGITWLVAFLMEKAEVSDEDRTILYRSLVERERPVHLAKELGMSDATIRSKIHRAKSSMRQVFATCLQEAGLPPDTLPEDYLSHLPASGYKE